MQEDLITFNTSKLALEKGIIFNDIFPFNYSCYLLDGRRKNSDAYGSDEKLQSNIPTQSLFQKYLREEYDISVEPYQVLITHNDREVETNDNEYCYKIIKSGISIFISNRELYKTYEEALEAGLFEALKLI